MGEQRALRWADIDFETRIMAIRRSAPNGLVIENSPKSWPADLSAAEQVRHHGDVVVAGMVQAG